MKREYSKEEHNSSYKVPEELLTCHTCDDKDTCIFAFDPYNTDGDCLASK